MNVLSLFDGCSMGLVALKRSGIKVNKYYASELDKYSEGVSKYQHPEVIRLGDVNNIDFNSLKDIDLVIAGFPCQNYSVSGNGKGIEGETGSLFNKVIECLTIIKPKYFLLENVKMKQDHEMIINELLKETVGEFSIHRLNSSLVSGQNRQRLYWTNIPMLHTIKDKGILLKDIIDSGHVDRDKSYCVDANYHKGGSLKQYKEKRRRQLVYTDFDLFENPKRSALGLIHLGNINIKGNESIRRFYSKEGKSSTITTSQGGHRQPKYLEKDHVRMLSVNECERLQTLEVGYTAM